MNLLKLVAGTTLGATLMFSGCGLNEDSPLKDVINNAIALTGSIDLSSLSSSDQQLLRSRATGDKVVKLYTLESNGSLKDTSYKCDVASDNTYSCPEVGANTEYVVRFVQDMGNGKVLELKTNASVGTTSPSPVKVDPVTTMVVAAVTEAVKKALSGLISDATLINTIIKGIKEKVTVVMEEKVKSGTLTVPSLVKAEEFTASTQTDAPVIENKNLATATGAVLSDSNVTSTLKAKTNEVKGDSFATLSAKDQLKQVFVAIGWGDTPPWVLDFFADKYTDVNGTFGDYEAIFKDSIAVDDVTQNQWMIDTLVRLGWTDANTTVTAKITEAVTEANTTDLAAAMKAELQAYFEAQASTTPTDAQVELLANFPVVIAKLFTSEFVADLNSTTRLTNVSQMFILMSYLDKTIAEKTREKLTAAINTATSTTKEYRELDYIDFAKVDPQQALLQRFNITDPANIEKYNGIKMGRVNFRADTYYDQATNAPTAYIALEFAGLSRMTWDMEIDEMNQTKFTSATIYYPKADGTTGEKTATIGNTNWGEFGAMLSPWDNTYTTFTTANAITDGITGDYNVTLEYNGTTYSSSQFVFVLQGAAKYKAQLTSPKGYPEFPENNATQAEMDAYNAEMTKLWSEGVPNYLPNTDNNTTLTGAVFTWDEPNTTAAALPSNIEVAYQVGINLTKMDTNGDGNVSDTERDNCNQNWDACNIEIYNTWNSGDPITTNSITLPIPLEQTTASDQYGINVSVIFMNTDTGEFVTQGGHSWAQFTVGQGTALSGSENIRFEGNVTKSSASTYTETNATIALIVETNSYNDTTSKWDRNVSVLKSVSGITLAAGTSTHYVFDINSTELKANSGNNKHIQVIAFDDLNSDGQWAEWTPDSQGEPATFMEEKWLNVDNFGDLRINVDSPNGHESFKVVKDANVTVQNLDITIK